MPTRFFNHQCKRDIFFLLVCLSCLFFILLGCRPLLIPEEGRYAEIAREMSLSHDFITPYLNGIQYFEKPPLFYWLTTLALTWGGESIWSLRTVNAMFAILTCLFTYATVTTLYHRRIGLVASLILGTNVLYFLMAHVINLDLTVTFFVTMTLYAFLLYRFNSKFPAFYFYAMCISAALAVLTKGLIGCILPFLIISLWLILAKAWRREPLSKITIGMTLFFLIVTPWHVLAQRAHPQFLYFYFIEQHFLRYLSPEIGHYQPYWFFIPVLIIGFFPWSAFLPQIIYAQFKSSQQTKADQQINCYWWVWISAVFLFFSFSQSKLISYLLPLFPPLSIVTARYLCLKKSPGFKLGLVVLFCFALIITGYFFYLSTHRLMENNQQATLYLVGAISLFFIGFSLSCICKRNQQKIMVLMIFTSLFLLMLLAALPFVDTRSTKPLAVRLNKLLQPSDEVVTYHIYYQDLPFYLKRRINILDWHNELTFGEKYQPHHEWLLSDSEFYAMWHSKKKVYVLLPLNRLIFFQSAQQDYPGFVVNQTKTTVLISNQIVNQKK